MTEPYRRPPCGNTGAFWAEAVRASACTALPHPAVSSDR